MKIKMKEERQFPDLGLKKVGEVLDVVESLGNQLIAQGFAMKVEEVKKITKIIKKEITEKKETKKSDKEKQGGKKK